MKTSRHLAAGAFISLSFFTSCLVYATAGAQQKPPVFRTRIDLLQLDVTVLDKAGRPVRGLTVDDFELLEDKKPQTIQGFTAVDIPEADPTKTPVWASSVAPDVTTNDIESARIFVLVIDDARSMGLGPGEMPDPWAIREMKASVALFISRLSPVDLVAFVFTNNTRANQNLTTDHARLTKAILAYPEDGGGILIPMKGSAMDPCLGKKYSIGTVKGVVNALAPIPDRRKAIVYFGGELPKPAGGGCNLDLWWEQTIEAAQQSHVTINPVDTMGLRTTGRSPEGYFTLAAETGGHAVVNGNDFEPGIRRIFLENSSYYLMAYQPTNEAEDGTFRRISLTVRDRPDLEVRTRRNYWAPKRTLADPETSPPPSVEALAGVLPLSALNLRVTGAAFAIAGTERAVVTLALGVRQPAFAGRTPEQVDVLVKAYTADGDPKGTETQVIPITVPAARADVDVSRYEVLARIELPKPGKYELRLSAHSGAADTRGSVYVDLDVPDFRKEKLSLSGVILSNAFPTTPVAPARALRDLIPVVPTTERSFVPSDPITAFLRLYQGGNAALTAATIKVQIHDAAGKRVFDMTEAIAADRFNAERAAEYQIRLPLSTLTAGEYLLTIEATGGKVVAKRDVRFQVR